MAETIEIVDLNAETLEMSLEEQERAENLRAIDGWANEILRPIKVDGHTVLAQQLRGSEELRRQASRQALMRRDRLGRPDSTHPLSAAVQYTLTLNAHYCASERERADITEYLDLLMARTGEDERPTFSFVTPTVVALVEDDFLAAEYLKRMLRPHYHPEAWGPIIDEVAFEAWLEGQPASADMDLLVDWRLRFAGYEVADDLDMLLKQPFRLADEEPVEDELYLEA